jgi:hypothetical protein
MLVWLWLHRDDGPGVRGITLRTPAEPLDRATSVIALPAHATWADAVPLVIHADGTSALLAVR